MISNYSDLIQVSRVRGRLYTDPEIFQHEVASIWNKVWVYLGHESEIPAAGDYARRQLGTQPVIMCRGNDGVVRVFYNRCRHRGNLLCHQDHGHASRFVCAYHAWTYANTGKLMAASFREGLGPSFERENYSLIEAARVELYRGLVFASLTKDGISLDAHLGKVKEFIDLIYDLSPDGKIVLNAGSQKVRYRGNWKLLPENSLEGDHHGQVIHKVAFDLFAKRTGFDVNTPQNDLQDVIRYVPGGHMVEDYRGMVMKPPLGRQPSGARLAYAQQLEKNHGADKARQLLTTLGPLIYVFPNLIYMMTHFRRIEPVSAVETITHYTPVLFSGVPDEINQQRLRDHEFAQGPGGFVTPDDVEIMERNQIGMSATGDDWLFIGRGLHREKVSPDGSTSGRTMDENQLRGFWRHYLQLMDRAHAER